MTPVIHFALACALLVAGCDGGDGSGIDSGVHDAADSDAADATVADKCKIGDLSAPIELQLMNWDAASLIVRTQPNQPLALHPAPQGGWMNVLGARARNLNGCDVDIKAAIIDTVDNRVIQLDLRQTDLLPDSEGWGISSADSFINLGVCPQATATRNMYDQPYILKILIEDVDGKKASAELTATPTCPSGVSYCSCECTRGYILGQPCS